MLFKIKKKGGKTVQVKLPSDKYDLNLSQVLQLIADWDGKDIVKAFSIMSGIDYDLINNNKVRGKELQIYDGIQWLFKEKIDYTEEDLPDFITIDDKKIAFDDDIGTLRLGQKVAISQTMNKHETIDAAIPEMLAFAFDVKYHEQEGEESKFDLDRALTLKDKILEIPAHIAYPVALFFLRSSTLSYQTGTRSWNLMSINQIMHVSNLALQWPMTALYRSLVTFLQLIRL